MTVPKLVILDRDGVLNQDRVDYVKTPAELIIIPGATQAVAKLNKAGCKVVVATNQSCINKGIITAAAVDKIHSLIQTAVQDAGGHIDKFYICPDNTNSPRRKPAPGMLLEALDDYNAVAAETPFIGDAYRDLQAAEAAGCIPVLVQTGKGKLTVKELPFSNSVILQQTTVCEDLADVVSYLLK